MAPQSLTPDKECTIKSNSVHGAAGGAKGPEDAGNDGETQEEEDFLPPFLKAGEDAVKPPADKPVEGLLPPPFMLDGDPNRE